MAKSYWENTGKHQALAEKLDTLLPAPGNSALVLRYRQFASLYYDIFNNGGCNYPREIRELFGWHIMPLLYEDAGDEFHAGPCDINLPARDIDWKAIHRITEPRMDRIIVSAGKEQGLVA